jgi:hypothetical protein
MSEPIPKPGLRTEDITEVSSVAKTSEPGQFDKGKPVHPEYAQQLYESLIGTLEQAGIDPEDVVVSGYHGDGEKPFTGTDPQWRADIEQSIADHRDMIGEIRKAGWPEADDLIKNQEALIRSEQRLLDRPNATEYFLAPVDSLVRDGRISNNPIDYAGVAGGIGVYARTKLYEIDPSLDINGLNDWSVVATPEELQSAQVLLFRPRYTPASGSPS